MATRLNRRLAPTKKPVKKKAFKAQKSATTGRAVSTISTDKLLKQMGDTIRPLLKNLLDDLQRELEAVWPVPRIPYDRIFLTLANLCYGPRKSTLPAAEQLIVEKAQEILAHYKRWFGISLWGCQEELHLQPYMGKKYVASHIEFRCPAISQSVKRKVGKTVNLYLQATFLKHPTDTVVKRSYVRGLDNLSLSNLQIVKELFDRYWARRLQHLSLVKVH